MAAAIPDSERDVYAVAADVLGAVRKSKSDAKRSLRTDVVRVTVRDTEARLASLALGADDVRAAGRIASLETEPSDELGVEVELAPPEA
ncbi:MAG: hypothetical protein IIB53_13930 [Planctomycetes bacterium]|nr:hypothetical protein [Planctomycetota bacterium]